MGRVDKGEVVEGDGPGCCSTGPNSTGFGTFTETSSPLPSFSGSGEVEEEREVVEDVVEEEE